jgi:uncharacterized membrane protein
MSNLIAIAYDDLATANKVRNKVFDLQKQQLIQLEDAVVVERKPDGKIKLHQIKGTVAMGATGGALWGGLIGLIFFMPLLGMAVGGAAGAAMASAADVGVNDKFMKDLAEGLKPGAAALFLLISRSTPDKVIPVLAPLGGQIINTSLSTEQETQLREAVEAARSASVS